MKRIDPDRMSKAQLDKLGAEAAKVNRDNTRPLTPNTKKTLAGAAEKAGRPRIGEGAERINITVERSLLGRADAYARKHRMTRAAVVAEGLRRVLAA